MRRAVCFTACAIVVAAASHAWAGSPKLTRITPPGGQRGTTVEAFLHGRYLDEPRQLLLYEPGLKLEKGEPLSGEIEINGRKEKIEPGTRVRLQIKIADDCPLGPHGLRLRTAEGVTEFVRFFVGPFPTIEETEQSTKRNDKLEGAQVVPLNSTVNGRMMDATDVDLYRIDAAKGQRISVELEAFRIGAERSLPDLYVAVLDADGKLLAAADDSALYVQDPVLSLIAERDSAYFVQVRHSMYNAANDIYRLHVGTFSRPTGLYPAGGQAGSELAVQVLGDPRGTWSTKARLPADSNADFPFVAIDPKTGVSAPSPNKLRVSPFPNVLEAEPNDSPEALPAASPVALPVAFNGILEKPGDIDCFRFQAKKGDRYRIHALANTLGSPLDPTIWIKSLTGKPGGGSIQRAADSRANQLGIPPVNGSTRDTLDPVIEFAVPADGEYVLGIEDDQARGGGQFVYRIECQSETDAIFTYIPEEPENRQTPQVRLAVAVPAGNRYNTQVGIFSTNRPFDGDLELVAVGLPAGVTMSAPKIAPGMTRVPVVFEAAPGTQPQGSLVDLLVRPVGADAKPLASGFRQAVPMNMYGNNDSYLQVLVDKLALAVTKPAPFSIEVEEPKSALVQNGETSLKFAIRREPGFESPVTVSMEFRPSGVTAGTPLTIPPEKSTGEYLLGASKSATAGSYQVVLTAVSGGARVGYNDTSNRTYVSSQPFELLVAEPHLEGRLTRTSIERGKTAQLVCKLNHLKPFTGKARATLARLPRGVELVEPIREITSGDKEVAFDLRATSDCLVGSYQGIVLDLTVVEEGQSLRQLSGNGMLRIDPERGAQVSSK